MGTFIGIVTIFIVIAYIGTAIWGICSRHTLLGSVVTSAGFLCGGIVIISIAEAIASFLCWGVVIALVVFIVGLCLGN